MERLLSWMLATTLMAGWAPCLVLAVHLIGSKLFSIYDRMPSFDVPMHLAGGAAIAYWLHTASLLGSARGILGPFHRGTHVLLILGWTSVAAVAWDVSEYVSDRCLGTRMQGDVTDTLKDVLLGLVGGTAVVAATWMRRVPRPIQAP